MKQGNWLITNNGLGSPTIVFLKKDEGNGLFSAWFYNPNFGLECADWGLFSIEDYPNSRTMSGREIANLGSKVLQSVA